MIRSRRAEVARQGLKVGETCTNLRKVVESEALNTQGILLSSTGRSTSGSSVVARRLLILDRTGTPASTTRSEPILPVASTSKESKSKTKSSKLSKMTTREASEENFSQSSSAKRRRHWEVSPLKEDVWQPRVKHPRRYVISSDSKTEEYTLKSWEQTRKEWSCSTPTMDQIAKITRKTLAISLERLQNTWVEKPMLKILSNEERTNKVMVIDRPADHWMSGLTGCYGTPAVLVQGQKSDWKRRISDSSTNERTATSSTRGGCDVTDYRSARKWMSRWRRHRWHSSGRSTRMKRQPLRCGN